MQQRKEKIKLENRISRLSEVDISIIQHIFIVSHWSQWPPEEQDRQVRERRKQRKSSAVTLRHCAKPQALCGRWLLSSTLEYAALFLVISQMSWMRPQKIRS